MQANIYEDSENISSLSDIGYLLKNQAISGSETQLAKYNSQDPSQKSILTPIASYLSATHWHITSYLSLCTLIYKKI